MLQIEKYSTNELKLAKMLFSFDEKVRKFVFRMLSHKQIVSVLDVVAKYVLTLKNPIETHTILSRYLVCVNYLYFKVNECISDDECIVEFDDIINNGISLELLEKPLEYNDRIFAKLYQCNEKTFKTAKKEAELYILKKIDAKTAKKEEINPKTANDCLYSLYNFYYYFSPQTNFLKYKDERRSCDLIIAKALTDDYFSDFSIDISEDEIKKNLRLYQIDDIGRQKAPSSRFEKKQLPQMVRNAKVVVGYLVDDIITRKMDIKDVRAISSTQLSCVVLSQEASYCTANSNKDTNYIEFLSYDALTGEYYVNLSKVVEFKLTYNGEEYIFNSEGLKKI